MPFPTIKYIMINVDMEANKYNFFFCCCSGAAAERYSFVTQTIKAIPES